MSESVQLLLHQTALFVNVQNTKSENTVVLVSCFCLLFQVNVPDIIQPLSLANNFDIRHVFVGIEHAWIKNFIESYKNVLRGPR